MSEVAVITKDYPVYDVDLFSKEALDEPFSHYAAIRELGPVVRLRDPNPSVLALSHYQDVAKALQSPEALISGKGTGFNDVVNQEVAEPGVLMSDGERHQQMRAPLMKYLSSAALKPMRPQLDEAIDAQVRDIVDGQTRNAMTGIAAYLPVSVISELVGLPEEDRQKMLRWASAGFNCLGPLERDGVMIPELKEELSIASEVGAYLQNFDPKTLKPGSWCAELFQFVQEGGMSVGMARVSLRAFVLPSLDTTINSTGNLLYDLATHPDQYEMLRRDPSLIPSAVYEGMRHRTIIRWFSRLAVKDYQAGEVFIPEGERVMILFGAANRDPAKYKNPDKFDVTRNPSDQLGWSTGPHLCSGKQLARMEMEALLKALVKYVARIEVDQPTPLSNRGVLGFSSLPMRLFPA